MLKVIHSLPIWLPQTQTWMHTQLCRLPPDRIEAHVVCERTENLDQFPVPYLHSLGGRRSMRFWWDKVPRKLGLRRHSAFLERVGRRIGVQLVHSHFGHQGWYDIPAARMIGARHVVTFYGFDVGKLPLLHSIWRTRYAALFSVADAVLCEGHVMGQSIVALGCPPEKLRIHRLGIPLEAIAFQPRRWMPGTPLRVLIAASFTEKKGIPDAIAALALLKDDVPLEITIIGDAQGKRHPMDEKQRILDAIERRGLASTVRLLGYQPHRRLFEEAYRHHVFLSPSITASDGDSEGGAPVSIIEMAATGMPVVSTRHCDIPAVVGAAGAGLIAAEGDVVGIADKLRWLLGNPEAWGPMLTDIRKHIERQYDAGLQGVRLADIYEALV